ncbi:MAG: glycosyltransferase [Candidatus Azobacteroides sp.]|nr:glycosyltransferase [Candidatus Azobacteroides sp.]
MFYSVIIPVFNRPEETDELLVSLSEMSFKNFEVIIAEDGSTNSSREIVEKYRDKLEIAYFYKENSGPGNTRNAGAAKSKGDYLIFLDSDCIVPVRYLDEVEKELTSFPCDAFGGPDRAMDSFTPVQKAINYAMTSFFITGGIRGGNKRMDKFYPRSFNMGIKKTVFDELGGFAPMRFGEDIDFSIRLFNYSFRVRLFPKAYVFHKRRTDFRKFFRQVYNSGIARINLYKKYPSSLKTVHFLPLAFTLLMLFFLTGSLFCLYFLLPILLFTGIIFIDSGIRNKSIYIGVLSVAASFIQLIGYGLGFLHGWWSRCILKKNEASAFEKTFYK